MHCVTTVYAMVWLHVAERPSRLQRLTKERGMGGPDLRVNEYALNWSPAVVTVPPVPAVAPGADPMSVMIAAVMPGIATEVTDKVAATHAREERFSANVQAARSAYQNTDGAAQQQIQGAGALVDPVSAAGLGSAPAAGAPAAASPVGQAGELAQLMGMPMQMAQQAAQVPMQMMGMAASVPQGIMQGVQSAVQQVGQLSGISGTGGDGAEKAGTEGIAAESQRAPDEEGSTEEKADSDGESRPEDGAAAGDGGGERAPLLERLDPAPAVPPAQTHPTESSPEILL